MVSTIRLGLGVVLVVLGLTTAVASASESTSTTTITSFTIIENDDADVATTNERSNNNNSSSNNLRGRVLSSSSPELAIPDEDSNEENYGSFVSDENRSHGSFVTTTSDGENPPELIELDHELESLREAERAQVIDPQHDQEEESLKAEDEYDYEDDSDVVFPQNMVAEIVADQLSTTADDVMLLAIESAAKQDASKTKTGYGYAYGDFDYYDGYGYASTGATTSTNSENVGLRMVNGYSVQPTDRYIDYMAAVRIATRDKYGNLVQSHCGGALLSPNTIITAAHCLPRNEGLSNGSITRVKNGGNDLDNSYAKVELGMYDRTRPRATGQYETYKIVDYFVTNYSRDGNKPPINDIAIIRFDGCTQKTPVKWNTNMSNDIKQNQIMTIMGWGATGSRGQSGTAGMEEIQMNIDYNCDPWAQYRLYPTSNIQSNANSICALNYDGNTSNGISGSYSSNRAQGPCFGDSGGPAILKGSDQSQDVLLGIVSYGSMCIDASQFPSMFTRVAYYQSWINSVLKQTSNPSCPSTSAYSSTDTSSTTTSTKDEDTKTTTSTSSYSQPSTSSSSSSLAVQTAEIQTDASSKSKGMVGSAGNMIQLKGGSSNDIEITHIGIQCWYKSTTYNIVIYERDGSSNSAVPTRSGNVDSSKWSSTVHTGTVKGLGTSQLTWIELDKAITLTKRSTKELYITSTKSGQVIASVKGSNTNSINGGDFTVSTSNTILSEFGYAYYGYSAILGFKYTV